VDLMLSSSSSRATSFRRASSRMGDGRTWEALSLPASDLLQRGYAMRNGLFIIIIVVVATSAFACGLQEEALQSYEREESLDGIESEPPSDERVYPGEPADLVEGGGNGDGILAGCSVVEWCNAPGFDGTRCQQTGCSVSAAIAECRADVDFVCGNPICPWIFTSITGARRDLCLH